MNFALIGAAGFVAERHLKAILETGNQLLCALDKSDSVGILDSYFPETQFFTELERFDRFVFRQSSDPKHRIDYVAICSPNHLHDAHIRFALRNGADAICEKPLVLNPWNMEELMRAEEASGRRIRTILQLRLHQGILELKKRIEEGPQDQIHDIDLTYITPRGQWYYSSWKADLAKSGGIATNIGVHFFDMLAWIFGPATGQTIHHHDHSRAAGLLQLQRARVRWFLSIEEGDLPAGHGRKPYRSLTIDGVETDFSEGFTNLHTMAYREILAGGGCGVADAMESIRIVHDIRNARIAPHSSDYHPLLKKLF